MRHQLSVWPSTESGWPTGSGKLTVWIRIKKEAGDKKKNAGHFVGMIRPFLELPQVGGVFSATWPNFHVLDCFLHQL